MTEATTERKPSAIDLKILDLKRSANYFKAVADGDGADKSSPEYQTHRAHMVALTIGAAIGSGQLYRNRETAAAAHPAEHLKALRADARWFAAAAASNLGIEKSSADYGTLSDSILDAAIATATATGKIKAPQRSFTQAIDEQREQAEKSEGQSR